MTEPAEKPTEARPLPVLAEPRVLDRPQPAALPAVVVAGSVGFLAGVAAWMLVRVLRRPKRSQSVRALRRRRDRGIEITGTRSFLVDVHLLTR